MIAYKFLARGAIEPLSGLAWPSSGQLQVCRAADLAYWLHEELWLLEAEGEQRDGIDCLLVERARLVRRIDAWHLGDALRFGLACAAHAAELVDRVHASAASTMRDYIGDALESGQAGYIGVSAHAAALAVTLASIQLGTESSETNAYRAERAWQSAWIAQHVLAPNAAL